MASGCEEEWIASTLYCKLFQHTELASLRCCVLASMRSCVSAFLRPCVPACVNIVVHLASMTIVADPPSMTLHPIPHHFISSTLLSSSPLPSPLLSPLLSSPLLLNLFLLTLFPQPAPLYILKIVLIIFRFTNHIK